MARERESPGTARTTARTARRAPAFTAREGEDAAFRTARATARQLALRTAEKAAAQPLLPAKILTAPAWNLRVNTRRDVDAVWESVVRATGQSLAATSADELVLLYASARTPSPTSSTRLVGSPTAKSTNCAIEDEVPMEPEERREGSPVEVAAYEYVKDLEGRVVPGALPSAVVKARLVEPDWAVLGPRFRSEEEVDAEISRTKEQAARDKLASVRRLREEREGFAAAQRNKRRGPRSLSKAERSAAQSRLLASRPRHEGAVYC